MKKYFNYKYAFFLSVFYPNAYVFAQNSEQIKTKNMDVEIQKSNVSIKSSGFITDSTLSAGIYYWNRHRVRKDILDSEYKDNLTHSTANLSLDFSSGYFNDFIGLDLGAFSALEFNDGGPAYPNEIGFSDSKTRWDEQWGGDRSGLSLYKAAIKLKSNSAWARLGYIQPTGQTLLAPHWSLMPGTYQGIEAGNQFDFGLSGALSVSYMWSNRYKAPWYSEMYNFRQADGTTKIDYLHSIGLKYDFKNDVVIEAAYGQAKSYMNQYFAKASYKTALLNHDLKMSYQFYASEDKVSAENPNSVYDGLAWLQALTFGYKAGALDWRLEGVVVKAPGKQGFFVQRMTPGYGSSNGRLDIWWNSRSDFNADSEQAIFLGVDYDLVHLSLPGWSVGTSYAYARNAKPSTLPLFDQSQRLKESAWNFDLSYAVPSGKLKGAVAKLHYTRFKNHSDVPSWGGGYGNIFQSEKDIKLIVSMPVNFF